MDTKNTPLTGTGTVAVTPQGGEPANIAPATEFAPSGAAVQTSGTIDPKNPAVDDNPRAGTTVEQNQIDFNDPRPDKGSEAVAANLNAQGVPTKTAEDGAEASAQTISGKR